MEMYTYIVYMYVVRAFKIDLIVWKSIRTVETFTIANSLK